MASRIVRPGERERHQPSLLVTVATFSSTLDAELGRAKLRAHGIRAFVSDEHLSTINPQYLAAAGGIRLQVRHADAETAEEILGDTDEAPDDEDDEDGPQCPKCGARYVYHTWPPEVLLVSVMLLGLPLLFLKKPWHCRKCDHRFHPEPGPERTIEGHPYRQPRPATRARIK
jgi:rubredoxin